LLGKSVTVEAVELNQRIISCNEVRVCAGASCFLRPFVAGAFPSPEARNVTPPADKEPFPGMLYSNGVWLLL